MNMHPSGRDGSNICIEGSWECMGELGFDVVGECCPMCVHLPGGAGLPIQMLVGRRTWHVTG